MIEQSSTRPGQGPAPARADRSPRIVVASRADPYDPATDSGATKHVAEALERRYDVVARVRTEPRGWQRYGLAGLTFHPSRFRWHQRFLKNSVTFRLQSRNSAGVLSGLGTPFDVVVQRGGQFQTRGAPYIVYSDCTKQQSARDWPEWGPFGARPLRRWIELEGRTYAEAHHVFAQTRWMMDSLVEDYGLDPGRITVVGRGPAFSALPQISTAPRPPTALFVGREYRRKGVDVLLEAFRAVRREVPDARLQLVGTDEVAPEPGVEVVGRVASREHMARLYAGARVFCFPSRFEPHGASPIEAMSFGVPCVVSSVGGLPETVVDGETGFVVEPDDAGALAGALRRLLEDEALAARMGASSRSRVEQHLSWERVVDRMAPVLDGLAVASAR